MLSKRRCPHTGVVNFYFDTDPHMAVGSIVAQSGSRIYWTCFSEPYARAGVALDQPAAERKVRELCHLARQRELRHLAA